jgi:hypothetical protein
LKSLKDVRSDRSAAHPRPANLGVSSRVGETTTKSNGNTPPTAKAVAEANAAWIGRAAVADDIPSSSSAWAPRDLGGDDGGHIGRNAAPFVDGRQFPMLRDPILRKLALLAGEVG